MELFAMF